MILSIRKSKAKFHRLTREDWNWDPCGTRNSETHCIESWPKIHVCAKNGPEKTLNLSFWHSIEDRGCPEHWTDCQIARQVKRDDKSRPVGVRQRTPFALHENNSLRNDNTRQGTSKTCNRSTSQHTAVRPSENVVGLKQSTGSQKNWSLILSTEYIGTVRTSVVCGIWQSRPSTACDISYIILS